MKGNSIIRKILLFIKYNSKLFTIMLASLFVTAICIKFYVGSQKIRNLEKNGTISQAYIYRIDKTTRSFMLNYRFMYGDREYGGVYSFSNWKKGGEKLSYKYYPVIFDPDNPTNSSLLFFKEDFEFFGFIAPDSIVNR